jgi:hypothetical protein
MYMYEKKLRLELMAGKRCRRLTINMKMFCMRPPSWKSLTMKGTMRTMMLGRLQTMKRTDNTISILVKATSFDTPPFPPSDWETCTQ